MQVFDNYAKFYDILYRDKNYAVECDFLEETFKKYTDQPVRNILDVGCGTGGHSILMAQRGYAVSGIDLSDKMLIQAREKAQNEGLTIDFKKEDVRDFSLNKKFDAAISMFAVIGYQITNQDLENTIISIRRHLKPGGLFVFDVWFGPAVLMQQPTDRVKTIEKEGESIIRIAQPVLDIIDHTVQVNYTLLHIAGNKILKQVKESHLMRYFFPQELAFFLNKNGFSVSQLSPFLFHERKPVATDWNISIIAKAV